MFNYDALESEVIGSDICTSCGACIAACPNQFIKFIGGKPRGPLGEAECANCDKCYNACYMIRQKLISQLGRIVFGRRKKENIGVNNRILSARTREENIKKTCQDGGMVTSLLIHLLEENFIDGALVVGREGWAPVAAVAKTREEITSSAGVKYGIVPILKELRAAVIGHGLSKVCVVGSPCHIQSIRYLQHHSGLPLFAAVKFTIGLFCRENYEYRSIEEGLRKEGLKMEDVSKFEIYEAFNVYAKGQRIHFPITEAKSWTPKHCLICEDFSSELADISIGSDGSLEGWSTVIVRTEEGERIFSRLEKTGAIDIRPLEDLRYVEEIAERKREKGRQIRELFETKEKDLWREELAVIQGTTEEELHYIWLSGTRPSSQGS